MFDLAQRGEVHIDPNLAPPLRGEVNQTLRSSSVDVVADRDFSRVLEKFGRRGRP
jgi:hypothetical protein